MKKPDLRTYANIFHFLQDLYKYRKALSPHFSYEVWAKELNIKSRSYLRLVTLARRSVTDRFLTTLADSMKLSSDDRDYLTVLTAYSQSPSPSQKELHGRKLMQMMRQSLDGVTVEKYFDFLSSPLLPKLQILLTMRDVHKNVLSLANMLNESNEATESALNKLVEIGLAEKALSNDEVIWSATGNTFHVPESLGDLAIAQFHRTSLLQAIQAQNLPTSTRRFESLMVTLNKGEFTELMDDVHNFIRNSLRKYDRPNLEDRCVYQLNMNLFPLSEPQSK